MATLLNVIYWLILSFGSFMACRYFMPRTASKFAKTLFFFLVLVLIVVGLSIITGHPIKNVILPVKNVVLSAGR